MLKRLLSITIVIMCLLCLASCAKNGAYVRLFGEKIPEGVYNYFYDEASDKGSEAEQSAEYRIKEYIYVQRLMEKEGLALSTTNKRMAAEQTEKLWSLFAAYYDKIGVSKQDIAEISSREMMKKQLLHFYYGVGGKQEVSEEKLRSVFAEKYVGFKAVEASFIKVNDIGESVEMAETEKKTLRSKLNKLADKVNAGEDIDAVNESYNESLGLIVTQSLSVNIVKENDPIYSEDFFAQVSELAYGKAAVIESGSSIYMLQRIRIDNDDENFSLYADEVLEDMKIASVEKKIEKMAEEE